MVGKIIYMNNNVAQIKITEGTNAISNLMNMHIVFEDGMSRFVGEVEDIR